jgi:hypothetical protein
MEAKVKGVMSEMPRTCLSLKPIIAALEHVLGNIPLDDLPYLMGELERIRAMAHLRLSSWRNKIAVAQEESRAPTYLTVKEVSTRFHVSERWLYRHKTQMPHSQPSRKVLLFPELAITRWFAARGHH